MLLSCFQLLRFHHNLLKLSVMEWGVNPGLCRFGSEVMWRGIPALNIESQNAGGLLLQWWQRWSFQIKTGSWVWDAESYWLRNTAQVFTLQTHGSSIFPRIEMKRFETHSFELLTSLQLCGVTCFRGTGEKTV